VLAANGLKPSRAATVTQGSGLYDVSVDRQLS